MSLYIYVLCVFGHRREQWQAERGVLEGETHLDMIEDIIALDVERCVGECVAC